MSLHDRIIPYLERLFGELLPPDKVKQFTVHFTWFHERFKVLLADATEDTVRIYARAHIMMLLSTQLFGDKSENWVHIRSLPFVARLDEMGTYSWGSAALAWLYRCMCRVANRNVTNLAGPLRLLQPHGFDDFSFLLASSCHIIYSYNIVIIQVGHLFIDIRRQGEKNYPVSPCIKLLGGQDIVWKLYVALDVLAVVNLEIQLSSTVGYGGWIFPQISDVQHMPEPALNID
ncbi:hypothetical protein Ahy_A09g045790 [Arachis hypogaea]|uniref:Aminotransferase-like plant mobile domain-containing protein n=1 Tax=Arachis hypogaea TaxID=3818 RepID=A0A445BN54_ARAHY|nr:hypothetical protein Ahy_A09g045790 [Arachis hypogaea]